MSETDALKRELAEAAGYTGEDAEVFASALNGETPEEFAASAGKLVELAESFRPKVYAVDPSQGRGMPEPRYRPEDVFARKLEKSGVMDRIRMRRRDPWTMSGGA